MMLEKSSAYAIFTECNQTKERHIVYKYIAFDFDGTLADSVDFCLAVFELVFKKYMGDAAPDREDIYQNFGMNEPGVLRHYMGKFNHEAENDFYQIHREKHPQMCPEAFPGCRELLEFLQSKGIQLAVVTGRAEITCNISLEFLGLKKYFSILRYGSAEKNDKAAQFRELIASGNLSDDEFIYVGDAVSDAAASHAANVKCLSAAWAKSARINELEKINPGLVFRTIKDMQKYLNDII